MENKTKEAVQALITVLKEDEDYYRSWKSSIAMSFKDEFKRSFWLDEKAFKLGILKLPTHEQLSVVANNAADNFLKLLIS